MQPPNWTPERQELHRWLLLRAPELGNTYAGALYIIESEIAIPGREHFVAHAAREIWNGVVDLVLGPDGTPRPADRFQNIVKKWRGSTQFPITGNRIEIPYAAFEEVDQNVRAYNSRETPRQKNVRILQQMLGRLVPQDELESEARNINIINRNFVRTAHLNRAQRKIDWEDTVTAFRYIEDILTATLRPSSAIRSELDDILEQANS